MNQAELKAIRDRTEKATPGRITRDGNYIDFPGVLEEGHLPRALCRVFDNQPNWQANGDYLVTAWNNVPVLLSEIERLQSELDELKRTMEENEWLLVEEDAEREYLEICQEKGKDDK